MSQRQVAAEAHVSRSIVSQLEEGRVIRPNEKVVRVLAEHTQVPPLKIMEEVRIWNDSKRPQLSQRAKYALALPAEVVSRYESYDQWRNDIAENVTQFCSLLGLSRNPVAQYELGHTRTMPKALVNALYARLDLSDEYVSAVMALPREAVVEEEE